MNKYEEKKQARATKTLLKMQKIEANYEEIKQELIDNARKKLGFDFLTEYYLRDNFSFRDLDENHFKLFCCQKTPLPFSNAQFKKFISMKKKIIKKPILFNYKGKNIYGTYLAGYENGKIILFAFSIVKGTEQNEDNINFSIKLDMSVGGVEWLTLLRFDSFGSKHANYIVNGKLVTPENIEYIPTPHIHMNTEEAQVLSNEDLQYTTALKCKTQLYKKKSSQDKTYFRDAIEEVFGIIGFNPELNKNINAEYNYNSKEKLYDEDKIVDCRNIFQVKENINEL